MEKLLTKQKNRGDCTLGDWKAFIDDLVRLHGTEMKIDFSQNCGENDQRVVSVEHEKDFVYAVYDGETNDWIESNSERIVVNLTKIN